ncbi:uncharacterized protein SPPG_06221 [Spizellomyces punctatus DAOM BR117]|uniref:Uncharacterized protein n=1 Tax=Spizellomyces punctatus (strain DAOM BR117) TaxID=645134 RepID=A0A0L0HCR2_SPIPD|nr:uncharacterized protein SPPG_06221 [Spizellomyces punctatus DAOM BR117]KNC98528.1 hypothetical protein SPPG_06221 [Spizellomyces punctatus DAOM BR117]|eukprot:XP_016606568.1 hypothetical protein SPPG_06221 [Spizellomyces punctatus DAOM BR117]
MAAVAAISTFAACQTVGHPDNPHPTYKTPLQQQQQQDLKKETPSMSKEKDRSLQLKERQAKVLCKALQGIQDQEDWYTADRRRKAEHALPAVGGEASWKAEGAQAGQCDAPKETVFAAVPETETIESKQQQQTQSTEAQRVSQNVGQRPNENHCQTSHRSGDNAKHQKADRQQTVAPTVAHRQQPVSPRSQQTLQCPRPQRHAPQSQQRLSPNTALFHPQPQRLQHPQRNHLYPFLPANHPQQTMHHSHQHQPHSHQHTQSNLNHHNAHQSMPTNRPQSTPPTPRKPLVTIGFNPTYTHPTTSSSAPSQTTRLPGYTDTEPPPDPYDSGLEMPRKQQPVHRRTPSSTQHSQPRKPASAPARPHRLVPRRTFPMASWTTTIDYYARRSDSPFQCDPRGTVNFADPPERRSRQDLRDDMGKNELDGPPDLESSFEESDESEEGRHKKWKWFGWAFG